MSKFKITGVSTYVSKSSGANMVRLDVQGRKDAIHVSAKQMARQGIAGNSLFNLGGSHINATFYQEGEELISGDLCTDSNVIVKEFSIERSMQLMVASEMASNLMAQFGLGSTPALDSGENESPAEEQDTVDAEATDVTNENAEATDEAQPVADAEGDVVDAEAQPAAEATGK